MIVPITYLRGVRFYWVAPAGALPGIGEAFRLTLVASALNVFVPAKAGDLVKGYFVATRIFGHSELRLLATRLRSLGSSLITIGQPRGNGKESTVRLQGNREWQLLWTSLTEVANDLPLHQVELDASGADDVFGPGGSCYRHAHFSLFSLQSILNSNKQLARSSTIACLAPPVEP